MKLALTGGPSGGKTTLAQAIQKEFSHNILVVPEAASMIFAGGFPRKPGSPYVECRQRAIYYVQRELEGLFEVENPTALLVCDRGSLDGVAYWPGQPNDFLAAVNTTLDVEISRYDWVIHLDTAPLSFYDQTNPLRTEGYDEAWRLNEKVKNAWSTHPRRFVINNDGHFVDKLHRALLVVDQIMAGRPYQEILQKVSALQNEE
jgi:predicted ATPase